MHSISLIVTVALCTIFGVQSAPATESKLLTDLKAIHNLIFREDLLHIINNYVENDSQVKEIVRYFQGDEVKSIINEFNEKPQVKNFTEWLFEKISQPTYGRLLVSLIPDNYMSNDILSNDVLLNDNDYMTGGWNGLIHDYMSAFPKKEFHELVDQIKASNEDFVEMIKRMAELKPSYEEFIREPKVIEVGKKLEKLGVNLKQLDQFIRHIHGWN